MAQTPPPNPQDDIIDDDKSRSVKKIVMARLKPNTWLNSISKISTFIGAPLLAAGVTMAATAIFGAATIALGFAAISAATIGVLAVGALFVTAAVATDYAASRIYQGCNFDNLEANADSTARHLVKEMKKNNMCLVNENEQGHCSAHPQKEWTKTIDIQRQQQQEVVVNQRA